jgi:hypothetical protein
MARLPTPRIIGKMTNVRAKLLYSFKQVTHEGRIIEMVVWRVPQPVPPSMHEFT